MISTKGASAKAFFIGRTYAVLIIKQVPAGTILFLFTLSFYFVNPVFSQTPSSSAFYGADSALTTVDSLPVFFNQQLSIMQEYDTGIFQIHRFMYEQEYGNFYLFNGHITQPRRNILYSAEEQFGLSFSGSNFQGSLQSNDRLLFMDTYYPITIASAIVGSKKEQQIGLLHSQNLTRRWNAGINLISNRTEGYFKGQQANPVYFRFFSSLRSKNNRFMLMAGFCYNRLISQLNGGILPDSGNVFLNEGTTDLSLKSVLMNTHKHEIIYTDAWLLQRWALNKKSTSNDFPLRLRDSLSYGSVFLELNGGYNEYFRFYSGEFESTPFYDQYWFSNTTNDALKVQQTQINLQLNNDLLWKDQTLGFRWKASCNYKLMDINMLGYKTNYQSWFANAFIGFNRQKNQIKLSSTAGLAGYNSGDYLLNASLTQKVFKHTDVQISAGAVRSKPSVFYNSFYSNHFIWNIDPVSQQVLYTTLGFNDKYLGFLECRWNLIDKYMFLSEKSMPLQLNDTMVQLIQVKYINHYKWRWLHITTEWLMQFQDDTLNLMGLPELFVKNNAFIEGKIFRKQLLFQLGTDIIWSPGFYGYGYNAALNQYFYQHTFKTGMRVLCDVYTSLRIKQVKVFVKAEQINTPFTGPVFMVPYYAMPGLTFKIGINWVFKN